jgi:hypothetical protein
MKILPIKTWIQVKKSVYIPMGEIKEKLLLSPPDEEIDVLIKKIEEVANNIDALVSKSLDDYESQFGEPFDKSKLPPSDYSNIKNKTPEMIEPYDMETSEKGRQTIMYFNYILSEVNRFNTVLKFLQT